MVRTQRSMMIFSLLAAINLLAACIQPALVNPPAAGAMLFRSKDPTTYVVALSAVDPSTLDPALD